MDNMAISVEHVKKIYKLYDRNRDRLKDALGFSKKPLGKEHYALNDVSFQVGQGETVGIIGTNGSGKSTILKIITGVLNPTDGEVKVNGRISALLELGAGFNMEYTGIENIYLNGTMIGFTKEEIDEKLQDILDFADIGDFVHQPVKTYSSGKFVRLAFAVAIISDISIIQYPCNFSKTLSSSNLRRSSENQSSLIARNRKKVLFPAPCPPTRQSITSNLHPG